MFEKSWCRIYYLSYSWHLEERRGRKALTCLLHQWRKDRAVGPDVFLPLQSKNEMWMIMMMVHPSKVDCKFTN